MAQNEDREVSIVEAAVIIGAHPETLRRHIDAGNLPARKVWNKYVIRMSDLLQFAKENEGRFKGREGG
jgi:excisionase family DNA binding protein